MATQTNNNTQQPQEAPLQETTQEANTQENQEEKEPEKVYTLEEDLEALKKLNLVRELCIKIQFKKHYNKETDALLNRRFNIDPEKVKGNVILRIIITIVSIFFTAILMWGISWLLVAAVTENTFWIMRFISSVLGFLTIIGMAIAPFLPFPVIDENKLDICIKKEMEKLEEQVVTTSDEQKNTN